MPRHFLALAVLALVAADWPQWRGPHRDGHAAPDGLPAAWPKQLTRLWKIEVGEGHGGPVVADGTVFVFSRQGDQEVLRGLDLASGKELWAARDPAPYTLNPSAAGHGKGPKSTPCVAGGKVYTLGIGGILACHTTAGKPVWRKAFDAQFKATSPLYGTATSPLIHNGLCVAWVGGHDAGALVALDADTGAEKWRLAEDGPGYTSPIVVKVAGNDVLVTQSQQYLLGVDPATGRRLWRKEFTTEYDQNSVTPVVADDLLIDSGYGQPVTAVRLTADGPSKPVWELPRHHFYMSSPVVAGGRLFGLSQRASGTVVCVDAKTGRVRWESDGRFGDYAAFVAAGGFVLAQDTAGKLFVLKAGAARFDPVAEYKVADGPTWAHPAMVGDVLLVKDKTHLYAWRARW